MNSIYADKFSMQDETTVIAELNTETQRPCDYVLSYAFKRNNKTVSKAELYNTLAEMKSESDREYMKMLFGDVNSIVEFSDDYKTAIKKLEYFGTVAVS